MAGRIRVLLLMMLCLPCSGVAIAADTDGGARQVIKPEIDRRKLDVDKIDTEDFELGVYGGILSVEDFGANAVIGARLAYHISEGVFVEAAYAQSNTTKTSYERLSGGAPLLTDAERKLTYYNISLGYNLFPGETFLGRNWAFNTDLYLIAGIGNTKFAGDDRFTWNVGAGLFSKYD